jgi:hypothetical protein
MPLIGFFAFIYVEVILKTTVVNDLLVVVSKYGVGEPFGELFVQEGGDEELNGSLSDLSELIVNEDCAERSSKAEEQREFLVGDHVHGLLKVKLGNFGNILGIVSINVNVEVSG